MEEIKNFAPVIIPTLNRYSHLKRLVESLKRCTYAERTELIIGLDYPPSEAYFEGYQKIKEYLPSICGFKKVTVLTTEVNLGAVQNGDRLADYAKEQGYNTIIFSEDDNEFSPCFLDYMNKALVKYRDNPKVVAICGYNYPVKIERYDKNIYAFQNYCAWGVAMWVGKVDDFPEDYKSYARKIMKTPSLLYKVWKRDPRMVRSLINSAATGCNNGDRVWTLKCLIEDKYCIYPTISLVRNWGNDGSGLHCGKEDMSIFEKQIISKDALYDIDDIEIAYNKQTSIVTNFLNGSLKRELKGWIKAFRDIYIIILGGR